MTTAVISSVLETWWYCFHPWCCLFFHYCLCTSVFTVSSTGASLPFLRQDFNGKPVHLNWVLYCQHSLQKLVWARTGKVYKNVIIKSAFQVLTKLLNSFISQNEVRSWRHLGNFSEAYCYKLRSSAKSEIWLRAAATILLCHKQLPALSVFLYVAVPKSHP